MEAAAQNEAGPTDEPEEWVARADELVAVEVLGATTVDLTKELAWATGFTNETAEPAINALVAQLLAYRWQ